MKTKSFISFLVILLPFLGFGQPPNESALSPEQREEIEGMKVAYLTSKMELTTEEAQVFWPVYNAFRGEMDTHREKGKEKLQDYRANRETMGEEELITYMDYRFMHQREAIDIEQKYQKRFLEVLPAQKVAKLIEAEESFKRNLLRRVMKERERERKRGGG